jgi:hypothetical protein
MDDNRTYEMMAQIHKVLVQISGSLDRIAKTAVEREKREAANDARQPQAQDRS